MPIENQMLNLLIIASVVCAVSVAANLFHWRRSVGKAFFCLQRTGWTQAINWIGLSALLICFALKAAKRLPPFTFVILALSLIAAEQLYSIWYRQSLPKQTR